MLIASPLPRRAAGFALIEVLVAIVIVSLGIGGVLFAQTRGLGAMTGAGWRAQASVLAEFALDRARANPDESYAVDFGPYSSGASLHSKDLASWKTHLENTLPAGDGRITSTLFNDPLTGRRFERLDVLVRWDDRRAGAGDRGAARPSYVLVQGVRAGR